MIANRLIGNGGVTPDGSGGMIPAVGPPFSMTRWVAQTAYNYVSVLPYNYTHTQHHGMQSTHQPAIWMGESCSHAIVSGVSGDGSPAGVESNFTRRGLPYVGGAEKKGSEMISPSYYSVELEDTQGGEIFAELTASEYQTLLYMTY
jgi:putative alpha-1,2-mannosidase